ncbi:hypothetical protein JMM81_20770 [Bacillus sp. V3B]|uniref:hypothetical protein n=1 Tax=Bacillus sp. V3B TaxID=2804915 RepID=UPI00210D8455|nr:hypothetical protein [Bacillus sp. V3B]MCQ6277310.1 hypothetical protein [Bacillus sp. V3B]
MAKIVTMNGEKKIVARRPNGVIEFRSYQPKRARELMRQFEEMETNRVQSVRKSFQLV